MRLQSFHLSFFICLILFSNQAIVAGNSLNTVSLIEATIDENDLITLSGCMKCLGLLFEGQFKVKAMGGRMNAINDANNDNGKIVVTNADSDVIMVAVGKLNEPLKCIKKQIINR